MDELKKYTCVNEQYTNIRALWNWINWLYVNSSLSESQFPFSEEEVVRTSWEEGRGCCEWVLALEWRENSLVSVGNRTQIL